MLNDVIYCAAIPTCRSGVSTIAGQMTGLITIVTHDLASTSTGHSATTTATKSTSTGVSTSVSITIIVLVFMVDSVSIRGALSHKVIAVTFFFIMANRLTKLAVGIFGNWDISLEKRAVLRAMLARGVANITINYTGIDLGGRACGKISSDHGALVPIVTLGATLRTPDLL